MKHIVLIFTFLVSFQSLAKDSFLVGWELWYPYQYMKQDKLVGLDVEILNAIAKKANININYTELPWKRHLLYLKSGDVAIAMGSSKNSERQLYAYFTTPYRVEEIRLFVLKGSASKMAIMSLRDLVDTDYILGVEAGYFYGQEYQYLITQTHFQSHINEVIDLEQNVKMLLKGYINGFLADPVTMKAYIDTFNLQDKFEQHSLNIYQTDIHFMLSKTAISKNQFESFNQAVTALKNSGELAQIVENWTRLSTNKSSKFTASP